MLPSFGPILGLELGIGLDSINRPLLEVFVHRIPSDICLWHTTIPHLSLERL